MSETDSFGVSAPTTSTTMALALGDALAVAVSNELHANVAAVFLQNHPGGAIGASFRRPQKLSDLCIQFSQIPQIDIHRATGANILMSAYQSESGWLRSGQDIVLPPCRIIKLLPDHMDEPASQIYDLAVLKNDWIELPYDTTLTTAKDWIANQRQVSSPCQYTDESVLVLMDGDEIFGVTEIGKLMV